MKISIPSFFTSLFFGSMLWLSGFLIYSTGTKFIEEFEFTKHLVVLFFYLILLATLIFMAVKWKWVIINKESIMVVYPLKFQSFKIELSEIKTLKWRLWKGRHRILILLAYYRMLDLGTKTGQQLTISDFEFQNFDSLESLILNSVNFKPNLKTRNQNRYVQAKSNIIFSIIILVIAVFIIITSYSKMIENNFSTKIPIAFFILGCLVLLRVGFQMFDYIIRIRKKA